MDSNTQTDYNPQIDLDDAYPAAFDQITGNDEVSRETAIREAHDDLLAYLLHRIKSDENVNTRRQRYASIDKIISTWQKLSVEDSKRKRAQEATGRAQAISVNLPVIATHIDEMAAFMAGVYAPQLGSYTATPDAENREAIMNILSRMNEDAAASGYYGQLILAVRSLLKYNIGGFINDWVVEDIAADSQAQEDGINWATAVDMYNAFWDPSVANPNMIRLHAEWFAHAEVVNRMHLIRREQQQIYAGCSAALHDTDSGTFTAVKASYYRYPPIHAGISAQDSLADGELGTAVNWADYGRGLGESTQDIHGGYELITMYCWLNPADFGLTYSGNNGELQYNADGYFLWKFKILNGERVIFAEPVNPISDSLADQGSTVIPVYMGYMNLDDMQGAARSIAELLVAFQSFSSFLMNAHVQGARSSIYGIKTYDPTMFDIDSMDQSDGTAAYLASKMPGRDVRTGLNELKGTFDGTKTMDQIGGVMSIMQQLFPAQAMPSQVAGLDRAIESQVAALMQGVTQRLRMFVRLVDETIFNPFRFDQYRNLSQYARLGSDLKDKEVRKALGSGLETLDREVAEGSIRQILFAMLQNPQIVQNYDVNTMLELWGSLLKVPVDVSKMRLQRNPPAPGEGTTEVAPPSPVPTPGGPAL